MKRTKSVRVYCVTRTEKSTTETGRGEATAETQDLRRRGGEETEGREEKQLQHRGAGEEEPEDAGSGMENLRKKRKNLRLAIRRRTIFTRSRGRLRSRVLLVN